MIQANSLIETLPIEMRLALAYAPSRFRHQWLAVLALDARLAAIVRQAREPILGQLRLGWWRDLFLRPRSEWPEGEPLVALLQGQQAEATVMIALINAWEGLLEQGLLTQSALKHLADARCEIMADLAGRIAPAVNRGTVLRAGRCWALADLSLKISDPDNRAIAWKLAAEQDWIPIRLPPALRPLGVLYGLAQRSRKRESAALLDGKLSMLAAMRLGLLGQ